MNIADLSKDTILFGKEYRRMCKSFGDSCTGCDLTSDNCQFASILNNASDIDKIILKVVQHWHDEHPPKTYAQDFRERLPNCKWNDEENRPYFGCRNVYYSGMFGCMNKEKTCSECWNEPMSKE